MRKTAIVIDSPVHKKHNTLTFTLSDLFHSVNSLAKHTVLWWRAYCLFVHFNCYYRNRTHFAIVKL